MSYCEQKRHFDKFNASFFSENSHQKLTYVNSNYIKLKLL